MVITVDIGRPNIASLTVFTEALVKLNMMQMRRGGFPPLYASGIRYKREGKTRQNPFERFQSAAQTLRLRTGDCEDLASYRVAELRLKGIRVMPWIIRPQGNVYHVQVRYPDGRIEDPSARLGMRGPA